MDLAIFRGRFLVGILTVFLALIAIGVWKQMRDPESNHFFNHDRHIR